MTSQGTNYITYFLIGIIASVSMYGLADKKIFYRLVFHPASVIHKKEYYRIVSSGMVHNNIFHLSLNLVMLNVFCSGLEEAVAGPGWLALCLIIFNSLVAGNMLSLLVYRRDLRYSCAGASAIAIGCMLSYMIFQPFESHVAIPMIGTIPNIYTAVGYLVLLLAYSRKFNGEKIDFYTHVGGAFGGLITTLVMYPDLIINIL